MLNILFWNLGKNTIEEYIIDCIIEKMLILLFFSEFQGIDFEKIIKNLGKFYDYVRWEGQEDRKVALVAKTTFSVELVQQQNRIRVRRRGMAEIFIFIEICWAAGSKSV